MDIKHVDSKEAMIRENHGKSFASINYFDIDMYYKLPYEEITLDED